MIDPVRNRLPDRDVGSRQGRKLPAKLQQQLLTRALGLSQPHIDLRRLDPLHMLVVLGPAGSARRRHDLGLRQQNLLDPLPDLIRFGQRGPG